MYQFKDPEAPATLAQLHYLEDLLAAREPSNIDVIVLKYALDKKTLTKRQAYEGISTLLNMAAGKKKPIPAYIPAQQSLSNNPEITIEPGIYDMYPESSQNYQMIPNGRYVVAYLNKYGKLTCKKLYRSYITQSGYSFRKSSLYSLSKSVKEQKATRLSKDMVALIGKQFNFCMCCGLSLTDPQSVADGVGPVCAKKFNY